MSIFVIESDCGVNPCNTRSAARHRTKQRFCDAYESAHGLAKALRDRDSNGRVSGDCPALGCDCAIPDTCSRHDATREAGGNHEVVGTDVRRRESPCRQSRAQCYPPKTACVLLLTAAEGSSVLVSR
jgi:hypothetical protein